MNTYPTTESPYQAQLLRLAGGQPIALHFKARNKVILLAPGATYGLAENILVIAGVGEKCDLIDLREINVTPMIRAGLSAHAATVLKYELERTYHADTKTYDNETSGSPEARRRRSRTSGKGGATKRARKETEQPGNGRGRKG